MFKRPILFLALATATFVLTNCNRNSGGKNPPSSLDMYELSFQHDGLNRSALVHIPENYDSSFALPVVLNFHGYGGNAAAHAQGRQLKYEKYRCGLVHDVLRA